MSAHLLASLNRQQLQAVTHPPAIPIQILAGPGSGKTKVLTCRIAHLIIDHKLDPASICAVTFTNKAANEMRDRLKKSIGDIQTSKLVLGTFHSICAHFLRRHAASVGLNPNFTICDAEESKKIIAGLLKRYQEFLEKNDITLKEGTVLSMISKFKAKSLSPRDILRDTKPNQPGRIDAEAQTTSINVDKVVAEVYQNYDKALKKANSLDFDDLLLYGAKLFSGHDKTVRWCKHILVDEFQDTNTTQYQLMVSIASANKCVSIVGDPDQSIYGWRSAEIENLARMQKEFPGTQQVFLEQNYRSTSSILSSSLAIISQDKTRIAKTLHTSHPEGFAPVLHRIETEYAEAAFIAHEIKRIKAYMGGVLKWGDFVILLRFNALSRTLEGALQKEGIPSRILGGHKFFERLEIKDLLAYLQLVDNPLYDPAFRRAVNVPARGIGDKTLSEIDSRANIRKVAQFKVVEQICASQIPDIKPPVKKKLAPFVKIIKALRVLAAEGASPPDLIRKLLGLTDYLGHLKRTQSDWETRWENVQELITFASEVEAPSEVQPPESDNVVVAAEADPLGDSPLRLFLHASLLSSEGDNTDESSAQEKVTISTCHAAKGLEWPVVFVPGVEKGIFPFYRAESVEEERRLLYVACTRAQAMLYLSHAEKRKLGGESKSKTVSEFVAGLIRDGNQTVFSEAPPACIDVKRGEICKLLGRQEPDQQEASRLIAEYLRLSQRQSSSTIPQSALNPEPGQVRQAPQHAGTALQATFTSGRTIPQNAPHSESAVRSHGLPQIAYTPTIHSLLSLPPQEKNLGRVIHQTLGRSFPSVSSTSTIQRVQSQPYVRRVYDKTAPMQVPIQVINTTANVPTRPLPANMPFQPFGANKAVAQCSSNPISSQENLATQPGSTLPRKRLGMGNRTAGYSNKKFKPMQPSPQ